MIRTQISLPDDQMRRAKLAAGRRGISLAALVRRALDRELALDPESRRDAAAAELRGRYRSGRSDVAEHHDEHLNQPGRRGW
jgi:hypothetical protein